MAEYGPKRYRLIFYGNILPEADPDRARAAIAQTFRLDGETLERCFSGRKVALRSRLDEREAWQLQSRLEDMGLITHLELVAGDAPPSPPPGPGPGPAAELSVQPVTRVAPAADVATAAGETSTSFPSGNPVACGRCGGVMSPGASFCRYCGGQVGPRGFPWAGVAGCLALLALLVFLGARFAWPHYQRLTAVRATDDHIEHALKRGESVTTELRDFITRTGFWPNTNLDAGLPEPAEMADRTLAEVKVADQALLILRFRDELPAVGGATLVFVPQRDSDGEVSWRCDGGTVDQSLMPPACRPPDPEVAYEQKFRGAPSPALPEPVSGPVAPEPGDVSGELAAAIEDTAHIRRKMLEFMMIAGDWPGSNRDVEIAEGRTLGPATLRRIEVEPGGRLLFELSDRIRGMEGHKLWLVPGNSPGIWTCESTLSAEYLPNPCMATAR